MWFINQVAAQILRDQYGYNLRAYTEKNAVRGMWSTTGGDKELYRLDPFHRKPLYQLTPEQVLTLQLLPTKEAEFVYVATEGVPYL